MITIKTILNNIVTFLFKVFKGYLNENLAKIVKETLERGNPCLEQTISVMNVVHDYCESRFNGVFVRQMKELLDQRGFKVTTNEPKTSS